MAIIKGRDLVVQIGGQPLYHATQHQVNLDAEYEEYQTKSVEGKQYALSGYSGTAQADGLVAIYEDKIGNEIAFPTLLDLFYAGEPVELILSIQESGDEVAALTAAEAYITSVSATGSVGQNATYAVSFKFNKLE